MKKFVLLMTVLFLGANIYAQTGQVEVTVSGIKTDKGGNVRVGIYEKEGFPTVGQEIIGKDLEVKEGTITVLFEDVPVENYAIAVFQDKDMDGKLDSNLFGAPTEPYGFSNNIYGRFGPPSFEDVSFDLEEGKTVSKTINLE